MSDRAQESQAYFVIESLSEIASLTIHASLKKTPHLTTTSYKLASNSVFCHSQSVLPSIRCLSALPAAARHPQQPLHEAVEKGTSWLQCLFTFRITVFMAFGSTVSTELGFDLLQSTDFQTRALRQSSYCPTNCFPLTLRTSCIWRNNWPCASLLKA